LKEVGLFTKDALLIQVLNKIRFQTDVMLVGAFLSLSAASVFYSSTTPAMMCFTLANLLMSNTLPGINEIIGTGDIDKVKVIYLKVLRYVLLLSAVAIFGITFCNKYVVLLWVGEGQYGGIIIDVLIGLQVGLLILNSFNGNFLVAMGKVKKISRVSAIITFVGLGLSMILVKTVGMTGLLISSVSVLLFGTVFFLWQIENLFGEKIYRNFNTYFPR
jgi:O-antigen/teichoic acid export membrane protein